jgi:hypothetical protein
MGTSVSKQSEQDRTPATKHHFAHTTALPEPYQLAIEEAEFRMTILEDSVPRDYDCDSALVPPTWFSVTLVAPTKKRFLYLVQEETDTGLIVLLLLFDRSAVADEGNGLRLPSSASWLRAIVDGTVYVLASDLVLSRKAITAWIGAREPPPAQPPYT